MKPVSKIYKEKTIEVGVYIDRHLYKEMEEVVTFFVFVSVYKYALEMRDVSTRIWKRCSNCFCISGPPRRQGRYCFCSGWFNIDNDCNDNGNSDDDGDVIPCRC